MNFHFENKKLTEIFTSLFEAINNEGDASLQIQTELDSYIRLLCENPEKKLSRGELLYLKENINKLTALAEQKRDESGKKVLKQKQNSKAIAKYRSV